MSTVQEPVQDFIRVATRIRSEAAVAEVEVAQRAHDPGPRRAAFAGRLGWLLSLALGFGLLGCGVSEPASTELVPVQQLQQGLCTPMDGGGDLGCGCTLNSQCKGFDDDARLLVCDVPSGATVGKCLDCTAATMRPVGCACSTDMECATDTKCNGRTCQKLRERGEYCVRDSDCGSDMLGAMTCLPTKSWCGPLPDDYYCDFGSDCISGVCSLGICTSGELGTVCSSDAGCKDPLICNTVTGYCSDKLADGKPCRRNAECTNQCNSFSGVCTLGASGTICTTANKDGDCAMGLTCTDCGGSFTCRAPGGPCG